MSGPIPIIRQGSSSFSMLLGQNTWLASTCAAQGVHFNFNLFWEQIPLFKVGRFNLNIAETRMVTSNLLYSISHPLLTAFSNNPGKRLAQPQSPLRSVITWLSNMTEEMDERHGILTKLSQHRTPRFIPSPTTFSTVANGVWHVGNHATFQNILVICNTLWHGHRKQ